MIYVTSAEWKRMEESLGAANLRTCMRHEHEGKVCMGGERMIRKGYLTNKSDCANWHDNYESYGVAIANGILDYLNMDSYREYFK